MGRTRRRRDAASRRRRTPRRSAGFLAVSLGDSAGLLARGGGLALFLLIQDPECEPVLASRDACLRTEPTNQRGADLAVLVFAEEILELRYRLAWAAETVLPKTVGVASAA